MTAYITVWRQGMTVSMNIVRGLGLYRKTTKPQQIHVRAELLLQRKRVVENGESGGFH